MLIDLTCPAEVFQVSLPTEEHPSAELILYNLSDRVIVSAEVTLRLQNDRGVDLERVTTEDRSGTEKHAVTLERIRFNNGTEWKREDGNETEYTPNDLPVSKALAALKFAAGERAKGFPSQQDGLWVCICGRPNPDSDSVCARCRQRKEDIFSRYNRDAVELAVSQREKQLDLATRSTREDLARLQRIREAEYRVEEARRKRQRRLAVCLAVFLALIAALLFWAEPALRRLLPEEAETVPETTITTEEEAKT